MIEQVTLSPSSKASPPGRQRSRAGSSGKGTPGSLLDISKDREVSQSLHQDDRLGSSPGVKAEVQGLGAAKASYWGAQSMEVSVLLWVSEHHFGRRRKGRGRRCAWPAALGPVGVGRWAGGLRVRGESTHSWAVAPEPKQAHTRAALKSRCAYLTQLHVRGFSSKNLISTMVGVTTPWNLARTEAFYFLESQHTIVRKSVSNSGEKKKQKEAYICGMQSFLSFWVIS